MRTLKHFKLFLTSGILTLGLSSCLDIPDPEFSLNMLDPYVQQVTANEFIPYFYIEPTYYANYTIKSANASNGVKNYSLKNIGWGAQTGDWQSDSKLPEGTYTISAVSTGGEVATASVTFDLKEKQIMGELLVDSLVYSVDKGIEAAWQSVENANSYCLALTPMLLNADSTYMVYERGTSFIYWDENNKNVTKGVYRGDNSMNGQMYKVAVVAMNGERRPNVVMLRDRKKAITIVWGKDPQ